MKKWRKPSFKSRTRIGRLWRDSAGALAIYSALLAPVVLGFAGLGIDIGLWYANVRSAQSAADSSARAGALVALGSSGNAAQILSAATAEAAANGFDAGSGDTITVNYPPQAGQATGLTTSVEVIVSRPVDGLFSSLLFDGPAVVAARAVAVVDHTEACMWALNPSDAASIKVSGNAVVALGCGVFVNSNAADALQQNGSGCLQASQIKVVGGISVNCATPNPVSGVLAVSDPLALLEAPSYGTCDNTGVQINHGDGNLDPGVYCGDIRINTNGTVHFNAGQYILKDAGLTINGQATVTGDEVTFYLTPDTAATTGISIAGGANVSLSAPTSGEMTGILFYEDRLAEAGGTHSFTGGTDANLTGILYFPNQAVKFAGGSESNGSSTMIVADTIEFTGSSEIELDDPTLNGNPLLAQAVLVE